MGYRSDVVIALSKETVFRDNLLTNGMPKFFKDYSRTKTEAAFYWHADDIKWYDSYEDIAAVEMYLDNLKDYEYGFLRVGEEDQDIEKMGQPWNFDIYTETTISSPITYDSF